MQVQFLQGLPKLSRGSGSTGVVTQTTHGNAGYAPTTYQPHDGLSYAPPLRTNRIRHYQGDHTGFDGTGFIGYHTHTPGKVAYAVYTQPFYQSDNEWQEYVYPPHRRSLVYVQVPQKYQLGSSVVLARPYAPGNYFLGYGPPDTADGGVTGRPLGS